MESNSEKLLRLEIDKNLNFNKDLSNLCQKVSGKVSALARMVKILPFDNKKMLILKTFIVVYCCIVP